MRPSLLFLFALTGGPAFAATPDEAPVVAEGDDDDDDLFKESGEKKGKNADVPDAGSFKDEDDFDIPTAPSKKEEDAEKDLSAFADPRNSVGASTKMTVDVVGKTVFADNWSPKVVISDKDAVVVEMPVLYALKRAEFDGVAFWVVAEAYADGKKVSEQRMLVTRDAIADQGPSIQFFRLFAPVAAKSGVIEVKVGKAASAAAKPTLLFTRSVPYAL